MPSTKPLSDAVDILGVQVSALWMVLRAFAATHPDLGALIQQLLMVEQKLLDQGIADPVSDRALELSHATLREMIESLETAHKNRHT
ncbi:MAG: hypothetical protein M3436_00805 [Pseudomonadota bacterium]|nr:hypothetical protein [Pseudomonadota bacterium]